MRGHAQGRGSRKLSATLPRPTIRDAASERDPAGTGSRTGTEFFRFTSCKNQNTSYVVKIDGTEGARGEARLRDEREGAGRKFLYSYLESAVTH
jgi:hypothetical protein